MSEWFALLSAVVATLACGVSAWLVLAGWPRQASGWLLAAGEGYLLGVLLIGNALWLAGDVSTDALFVRTLPWLLAASLALFVLAFRLRRPAAFGPDIGREPASPRERTLAVQIALLLAGVFLVIAIQAYTLPTLTWDAWNAWLAKAKGWTHAGAFLPVVNLPVWLATTDTVLSAVAAGYPEAIPRYATWLASAVGRWHDGSVHLAWPLLWAALGCMLAAALRLRGIGPGTAAVAALFLLTLPLITAHASLAGYADLWLAAAMLAASHHAARCIAGQRQAALPALVFALLMPTIKIEGAIWLLLLAASVGLWSLRPRWRWSLLASVAVVLPLLLLWLPSLVVPVPGLGAVVVEADAITVPVVGRLELFWRGVGGTVAQSMLLLPNWSLLFWLAPLVVLWRWRCLAAPAHGMLAMLLLLGASFLFVLFFFTDAARWAEDLTSLNRLLLHLVPLLVYWLVLLLVPVRPPVRGRWA
jgi:hypothetical protein